jgi:hypothetical protein
MIKNRARLLLIFTVMPLLSSLIMIVNNLRNLGYDGIELIIKYTPSIFRMLFFDRYFAVVINVIVILISIVVVRFYFKVRSKYSSEIDIYEGKNKDYERSKQRFNRAVNERNAKNSQDRELNEVTNKLQQAFHKKRNPNEAYVNVPFVPLPRLSYSSEVTGLEVGFWKASVNIYKNRRRYLTFQFLIFICFDIASPLLDKYFVYAQVVCLILFLLLNERAYNDKADKYAYIRYSN